MMDGTVLAWKRHYGSNILHNIIQWLIVVCTGHPYTHLAVYCKGYTWESTGFQGWGFKRTIGVLPCDEHWPLKKPLTPTELAGGVYWLLKQQREGRPYNVWKFLLFPLRGLWRLLKWAPFDNHWLGEVCYTFVDEFFLACGRDMVKGRRGYATAWDFRQSGGFEV